MYDKSLQKGGFMYSIEAMFPPSIWKRGREYFNRARVQDVEIRKDFVGAKVVGNEIYHVQIFHNNSTILKMKCNCPYAQGELKCKHMAALLIQMDALGIINTNERLEKPTKQGMALLDEWQKVVDQFVGGRNWINYIQNRQFDRAMSDILSKHIQKLTINNYKETLKDISLMIKAMNQVAEEITIEDTLEVLSKLFHKLKHISLLKVGRDWAKLRSLETNRLDLVDILIQHAFSMDEQGLQSLNEHIQLADKANKLCVVEICLRYHIKLMKYLQYEEETIIASLDAFYAHECVLDYVIAYHMENKNYKLAKGLLLAAYAAIPNLDIDKNDEIKAYLLDIAVEEKDCETVFQFIEEQLSNPHLDYPVYLAERLRNFFDSKQDWHNALWSHTEDLKTQVPYHRLLSFYLYLKEYDCFYDLILQRYDISSLLEYMEELMEYDAPTFQQVFYILMKQEMEEADKAAQYKDILCCLQSFKIYRENHDALDEIVTYAKAHYNSKNVFMKYLRQLY